MRKFCDDRSRAYNDIFPAVGVGDVNVGVLYPGTIKAFHRHQKQDDYWFVVKGNLRAVLVEVPNCVVVDNVLYSLEKPGARVILNAELFHLYSDPARYQYTYNNNTRADGWSETYATVTERVAPAPVVTVHYLNEGDSLHIPAGLWHGLQVLGNESAIMIYHITNKYNPENPDEERTHWDAFYTWKFERK